MPPKSKFTKEQIVEAALDIIREKGADCLTSRALGRKLGSSSCPIFTVFNNMKEVKKSTIEKAKLIYKEYVDKGLTEVPAFKGVGTQYILFAMNEPNLFKLLFMTEQNLVSNLEGVLPMIDENYEQILLSIVTGYGVERDSAERLYRHLWIYTHGIATLCITNMCCFTGKDINDMMAEVFLSLLAEVKGGRVQ